MLHNSRQQKQKQLKLPYKPEYSYLAPYTELVKIMLRQEDEEEDVRSYWMTLRTGEDTVI